MVSPEAPLPNMNPVSEGTVASNRTRLPLSSRPHWSRYLWSYTDTEIAEMIKLPPAVERVWSTHGYCGSVSDNVKAIYQRYMGCFVLHRLLVVLDQPDPDFDGVTP
jgi:hypothetical protein